ncbi:MAG: non-heme iron oxygenase ferredoxin subunit [Candidatus Hydrogenedentes bacterium]|nr:non-heme iron oxygenase ferredoxin subunit [Candidatus Hydrogenedentota bacterium]
MAKSVKVAQVSEIAPGKAKEIEVEGKTIAVFNVDGKFYAIDGVCTHVGGPLAEGDLQGCTVTCPWHGAEFDVTSGKVLGPPADDSVASYPTRTEGNDILIDMD